jgi:hypothetical protein
MGDLSRLRLKSQNGARGRQRRGRTVAPTRARVEWPADILPALEVRGFLRGTCEVRVCMHRSAHLYSIRPALTAANLYPCGPGRVSRPLPKRLKRHGSDVDRGVCIRVSGVAARETSKVALTLAVAASGVPALGAGRRGSSWVNKDDLDAGHDRLVPNLVNEVAERPTAHQAVEPLASPDALPNAIELLEGYDGIRKPGRNVNQLATELVIDALLPAPFLPFLRSHPVSSAMSLVATPEVGEVLLPAPYRLAVPLHDSIGRLDAHQPHDPEVDTEDSLVTVTDGRCHGFSKGQHHEPVSVAHEQLCIASNVLQAVAVFCRHAERSPDVRTTHPGRDAERPVLNSVRIHAQSDTVPRSGGERHTSLCLAPVVRAGQRHRAIHGHSGIIRGQAQFSDPGVAVAVDFRPTGRGECDSRVEAKLHRTVEKHPQGVEPCALPESGIPQFEDDRRGTAHSGSTARYEGRTTVLRGISPWNIAQGMLPLAR